MGCIDPDELISPCANRMGKHTSTEKYVEFVELHHISTDLLSINILNLKLHTFKEYIIGRVILE